MSTMVDQFFISFFSLKKYDYLILQQSIIDSLQIYAILAFHPRHVSNESTTTTTYSHVPN